jgi:protease-4
MWQAARAVAAKKPLVISIGSMAASGGYYLASAGDQIYADPTAIVGSIGVVGGKFVTKDLFDKLGIGTAPFRRGRNAGLFSSNQPFDERQRRMVTNWMKQTYEQFTRRVMTTRKGKIKDIDQVARGRIFMAKQARELGMVDEIGGIEAALADAAGRAKLAPGAFDVRVLPRPTVQVGETSLLRALDASTRRSLTQHLDMLRLLQDRPVVLVSPFTVTVR